jgi:cyclic pyranopterin phosphate synthase
MTLTHLDERGAARMVDVSEKSPTVREAVAAGEVWMQPQTLALIQSGGVPKGDVLAVARIAGIMAAKRTPELIPLCHPLPITAVEVDFSFDEERSVVGITARVRCTGVTGVEMEALTAVVVAALTVYWSVWPWASPWGSWSVGSSGRFSTPTPPPPSCGRTTGTTTS